MPTPKGRNNLGGGCFLPPPFSSVCQSASSRRYDVLISFRLCPPTFDRSLHSCFISSFLRRCLQRTIFIPPPPLFRFTIPTPSWCPDDPEEGEPLLLGSFAQTFLRTSSLRSQRSLRGTVFYPGFVDHLIVWRTHPSPV